MKEIKEKTQEKKRVQGFQVIEEECIWMKAGMVNFRLCDNAYDCYNCPFDRGMRKANDKPKERSTPLPPSGSFLRESPCARQ